MNILKLSSLYNDSCDNLVKTAQEIFQAKVYFWLEKNILELIDELIFINKDNVNLIKHKVNRKVFIEISNIQIPIDFLLEFYTISDLTFLSNDKQKELGVLISVSTIYMQDHHQISYDSKRNIIFKLKTKIWSLAKAIVNTYYKIKEYSDPKVIKRFDDYYKGLVEKRKAFFKDFGDKNLFKNNPDFFDSFVTILDIEHNINYTEDDYNEYSLKDKINKFYNSETAKMLSEKERQERVNKLIEQDDIYHKVMMEVIMEKTKADPYEMADLGLNRRPKYETFIAEKLINFLNEELINITSDVIPAIENTNDPFYKENTEFYYDMYNNLENYFLLKFMRELEGYHLNIKHVKPITTRIIRKFIVTNQDIFYKLDKLVTELNQKVNKS